MLKLQNVDKYFYRRQINQIHVINDTTLEFGESGLTAFSEQEIRDLFA